MLGEPPHRLAAGRRAGPRPARTRCAIDGLRVPGRLRDFSLTANAGRIYALAGQLGSGASDVLRAVAGLHPTATGAVELHGRPVPVRDPVAAARRGRRVRVQRPQVRGAVPRQAGRLEPASPPACPPSPGPACCSRRREHVAARALAEQCGLPEQRLGDPVVALSGGNQQKAFVGRCLGRDDVRALLLDEPTRGVDIGGRAAIHHLLRAAADAGLVVLFASTELEELLELGDVIVTMRDGRVVSRYEGDVDGALLMRDMTTEDCE